MKIRHWLLLVPCALAGAAYAGPDWVEIGDAGSTLGTAQAITGIGSPMRISGTLSSSLFTTPDLEDVYLLRIEVPSAFRFDMSNADFDTMLYLFNVTTAQEMFGLLANNDSPTGPTSLIDGPNATDASGAMVLNPGVYALGITGYNRRPISRTGDIYFFASNTETSGPDGPGGTNPVSGWTGVGSTGSYDIDLEGIGYVDVPAPGAAALLGLGGFLALRRRR